MKKIIFIIIFIITNLHAINTKIVDDEQARNAAMTLNYLHGSLNKIVMYNDKIVLEEEYSNIINNLNLTVIKDEELVNVITSLMNTLTKFRLSEMDRDKFKQEYAQKLESAMTGALVGLVNTNGINPIKVSLDLALNIGNSYYKYNQAQKSLKNDLKNSTYILEKSAIKDLNKIRKDFILTYWEIMKRYNMPDKWRISEKQFTRLINVLKDTDNEKKYRQLLRMREELSVLPMFWNELSLVCRQLNKQEEELKYIDIYESLNDSLLRENNMYSLLLANKASYLHIDKDKEEIQNLLEKIYTVDPLNANRKLFMAMKYIQLKNYNKADELLTQNIDDDFLVQTSNLLKVHIYMDTNKTDEFESTIIDLLQNQNLSASEYLYYIGKRPTVLLLKEIKKEIQNIDIKLNKNTYGKENLEVKISKKWVINDIEDTEFNLKIDEGNFKFYELNVEDKVIEYVFKNVIDLSDLIEKKEKLISFKFNHKKVPIELVYKMAIHDEKKVESVIEKDTEKNKSNSYLDNFTKKITKTIEDTEIVDKIKDSEVTDYAESVYGSLKNAKNIISADVEFIPIKILTREKCYEILNDMKECK